MKLQLQRVIHGEPEGYIVDVKEEELFQELQKLATKDAVILVADQDEGRVLFIINEQIENFVDETWKDWEDAGALGDRREYDWEELRTSFPDEPDLYIDALYGRLRKYWEVK